MPIIKSKWIANWNKKVLQLKVGSIITRWGDKGEYQIEQIQSDGYCGVQPVKNASTHTVVSFRSIMTVKNEGS